MQGETCKKRGMRTHPINIGQPQASTVRSTPTNKENRRKPTSPGPKPNKDVREQLTENAGPLFHAGRAAHAPQSLRARKFCA
ncbi:hypothetical protein Y032_0030g2074 [Ancylostoma ceylanicum]|nr:hypothetical protein Y032_0030g2074 [Ancylostoma ceylanicum]